MATRDDSAVLGGVTLEEIAERNPHVSIDQVSEALALMDKLRQGGFGRPRYDLDSPYGHVVSHQGDERDWTR